MDIILNKIYKIKFINNVSFVSNCLVIHKHFLYNYGLQVYITQTITRYGKESFTL